MSIHKVQLNNFDFERLVAGEEITVPVPGENEERVKIKFNDINYSQLVGTIIDVMLEKHRKEIIMAQLEKANIPSA